MSRIKLNLRQAVPDKLQTGRQIIAAMTNNPNFATPHPPLADVTAVSPDPPSADSWGHAETVTIASKTIQNLTSGKKYWFRWQQSAR